MRARSGPTRSSARAWISLRYAWTSAPPVNPNLGAMESRTSAHTDAVNEALQQSQ